MPELTVENIILEISNSNEVVALEVLSGDGTSIDDNAGLGVISRTWSANKIKTEVDNVVVGLVEQLDLKAPISDTITRAEYQLLFAKVASVETLLMSLVGGIYVA